MIKKFSPKRFSLSGFTLLEVIIVLGILAAIFGLGLLVNFDAYRSYTFRSEREVVVSELMRARSRAINNIYQNPWGVCVVGKEYVMFRGTECIDGVSTNETLPINPSAQVHFSDGVVFSQLAGTTTGGMVTIVQDNRTATVTINYEGTIDW